ncbi:AfsR/SARP family transcriptional regulator [Solicola gregarius]|uniref:Tetratricopeptide repeat protein n=1 Tax=Solicola gregarius TaxID=2908642 RepID=A0AA46TH47_9ACTN|nr:BTAD domain-containing putative transcriptional regulator [Solicola gregarius]UYM05088.1 tetratricopeptide repeat protein [Solicola gregarius]
MIEVRLIGAVEAIRDGEPVEIPGRRVRALLALLALTPGKTVSVESLANGIWDDEPPERVRGSLQTYVGRLRRVVGEEAISTDAFGYRLDVPRGAVDLMAFADSVAAAADLDDDEAERAALAEAIGRWHGEPFGEPPSEWIERHEVSVWTERYLQVVERRVDLDLAAGDEGDVLIELNRHVQHFPLRETLWLRLLVALDRSGRTAEALARYESLRQRLAEELGVDPSPELRAVYADLLNRTDEPLAVASSQPPTTGPCPRQLPLDVPGFVGRDELFADLDAQRASSDAAADPCVIALHGPPGSGKTTLAVRWAHRVKGDFPDGQLFLNLQGYGPGAPIDPTWALDRLLRGIGVHGSDVPYDVDDRAAVWRTELSSRRMLVVLDNARDAASVRPLLPGGQSTVLVTSRSQVRALAARDGVHRLAVERMSAAESTALLRRRITGRLSEDELAELADLCGHLPVALAVAAERVDRSSLSTIAELRGQIDRGRGVMDALSTDDDDPATNVRAVLAWSYEALDEPTARLFRLLGLWEAPRIPVAAASALAGAERSDATRMLDRLANHHLLTDVGGDRYETHDLIRELASEIVRTTESAEARSAAEHRLRNWFLHSAANARAAWRPYPFDLELPPVEDGVIPRSFASVAEAYEWFDLHIAYLQAIVHACIDDGDPIGHHLAPLLSTFLASEGVIGRDGPALFERAEASARRLGDRAGQANCANSLAQAQYEAGDNISALDSVRRSRELHAAAGQLGGELCAQGNVAIVLQSLGRSDAALEELQDAVERARDADNRLQLGTGLLNLSDLYRQVGRLGESVRAARESVDVLRAIDDPNRLAVALDNLADVLADSGRPDDAVRQLGEAIERYRAAHLRSNEANALRKLGVMHRDQGRPAAARPCWLRAAAILTDVGSQGTSRVTLAELNELIEGLPHDPEPSTV